MMPLRRLWCYVVDMTVVVLIILAACYGCIGGFDCGSG